MSLYIGLMSGTSMDGIDAALVNANNQQLIAGITHPYADTLQQALLQFDASKKHNIQNLLELNHHIGQAFSEAVTALLKETAYSATDITAIGSHGQTLYHNPEADIPTTLQLACPHTIANNTDITVVSDFRTRDLTLGGQGAPLAPIYHQKLLKNQNLPAIVANIGGIANISLITPSAPPIGYDTGPGNVLMDLWIKQHQNTPYDANGFWASTGTSIPALLDALLNDAYFKKEAPKSIDKGYYSKNWLNAKLKSSYKASDVQATLLHFTARSLADAIKNTAPTCNQLILCGGGAHNQALIQALQTYLPHYLIHTTAHLININPDYLEAMMFAWLAEQTLAGNPIDLTHITGSKKPAVLGAIYPR
jgi:anhydro-N-acetylmuramic acid kinase